MRQPQEVERLYLDFDGFFASVEQAAKPALRGHPVAVVPFAGTDRTCVIACSREAKLKGVKNVMPVQEARNACPDIVLIPQSPDLYRRAHNALISEIEDVIPIDAVKSIDEMTCRIEPAHRGNPEEIARRIKAAILTNIGPYITCSIGISSNRQLAKMACKAGKWRENRTIYGDGLMIWHPRDMPGPLLEVPLDDVPGIGKRLKTRLLLAGIRDMQELLSTAPKQLRALWGNVTGERLWYALNGYDVQTPPSGRGMYGHGRVLPPDSRDMSHARGASRLLLVKAARRMRRDGWNARSLSLWLSLYDAGWGRTCELPDVHDDHAVLSALMVLWEHAARELHRRSRVVQVHVTLFDLTPIGERQLDLLTNDDDARQKWERLTAAIDGLNTKHGRTLVSLGQWAAPSNGYAGGKISFTRVPSAEDFW